MEKGREGEEEEKVIFLLLEARGPGVNGLEMGVGGEGRRRGRAD